MRTPEVNTLVIPFDVTGESQTFEFNLDTAVTPAEGETKTEVHDGILYIQDLDVVIGD